MKRSASEIIRNLESRVAQLESSLSLSLSEVVVKNMKEWETRRGIGWSCTLVNSHTKEEIATVENDGDGGSSFIRASRKNRPLIKNLRQEAEMKTNGRRSVVLENLVACAENGEALGSAKVLRVYKQTFG
jgi:predicted methyltransferase MtxX (methanogen marker protein 4)